MAAPMDAVFMQVHGKIKVNFSVNEENASVEMNCSGKDPLISIAVALWVAVIASVFFIYLYWRHIHLKPSFHVSCQNNSEMQETNLHSGKTTDLTVEKELEQRETEQYESLKGCTNQNEDVYHTLDTKQQESSLENEESIHAKDF